MASLPVPRDTATPQPHPPPRLSAQTIRPALRAVGGLDSQPQGQGNGQEEIMGVREEGGASPVTVTGGGWAPEPLYPLLPPGPVAWPVGCSQRLWDQGGALPGNLHVAVVGSWPPAGGDGPGPQAVLTIHGHGPAALSGLTWLLGLEVVPIPQILQRGVPLGAGRWAPGGVTRCIRPSPEACLCTSGRAGALCLERVWWAVPGTAQTQASRAAVGGGGAGSGHTVGALWLPFVPR